MLTWCNNGQVETSIAREQAAAGTLETTTTTASSRRIRTHRVTSSPAAEAERRAVVKPAVERRLAAGKRAVKKAPQKMCEDGITDKGCCDGTSLVHCFQGELNTLRAPKAAVGMQGIITTTANNPQSGPIGRLSPDLPGRCPPGNGWRNGRRRNGNRIHR